MRSLSIQSLAILFTLTVYVNLHAQMGPVYLFELNRSGSSKTDFVHDDGGRDLSYQSTKLGFRWMQPLDFESSFVASIGFKTVEYDFGGEAPALWGDVETISGALLYEREISEIWSLLSVGFAEVAYETGASAGDGLTWGVAVGGKYVSSDRFQWVLGVAFVSRLEDNDLVFPLLGFEWQVSDRLQISSLLGLSATYDLSGDGTSVLETGFDFNLTDFRLQSDSTDEVERAIRPEGFGWYVSYSRQLLDWVRFSVKVTAVGETEFEFREAGNKLETYKIDSGMVASAGFTFVF